MKENKWLIDISLVVIIIVMGVFVVIELNRTFDFWRQRSITTAVETDDVDFEDEQPVDIEAMLPVDLPEMNVDDPNQVNQNRLELENLEGETISLSDFQGTPMLINFWATWCPPCLEEMPLIQAYADRYEGDLIVLAINAGEDAPLVRGFVAQHQLNLNILLDPTNSAVTHFRVYGFPTTLFFDQDGDLQSTHIGELNQELIDKYLLTIGLGE